MISRRRAVVSEALILSIVIGLPAAVWFAPYDGTTPPAVAETTTGPVPLTPLVTVTTRPATTTTSTTLVETPPPVVPATALVPAVRVDPPTTQPAPVAEVVATGLHGKPFAPSGLDDCDELSFYRQQWGLPAKFDALGYRETRCIQEPHVKTFCCYGWWQLYFSIHMKDPRMQPVYADCGVNSPSDYDGPQPIEKQRQACVAKGLYDLVGYQPWAL